MATQSPVTFNRNGITYSSTGTGIYTTHEPGTNRWPRIFRAEFEAAYQAHIRDLFGDDLDALEEARDMRDDIQLNAPPGY